MKSTYLTAVLVFALACAAFATLVVGYQAITSRAPEVDSADHAAAIESLAREAGPAIA